MAKIFALIAFSSVLAVTVVSRPKWLSANEFLMDFASQEALALMSVILTVTLASVANIHVAINRVVTERFNGNGELKSLAKEVKSEITDNAWYIFAGFVVVIVVLLVKGLNMENEVVLAICHAIVLWILLLYVLCMLDIYRVIFGILNLESDLPPSK